MLLATVVSIEKCAIARAQPAEPTKADEEDAFDARRTKLCRDEISRYTLSLPNDKSEKFVPKEVMKWANPVRDRQIGVVSIWVKDGRAQAMSTIFTTYWPNGSVAVTHEFQSLATRPIVASMDGAVKWSPAKAGIVFQSFPEAPEPAQSPVARLRQMSSLVREFSAHSVSIHGVETRWELRMLTRPLYRYEGSTADVLDGAVFAFVSNAGTDPELIVLVEARRANDGWQWQYAAARFSDHSLYLRLRERDVWSFVNEAKNSFFAADVNDVYRLFRNQLIKDTEFRGGTAP
jgi:hypothetical protein